MSSAGFSVCYRCYLSFLAEPHKPPITKRMSRLEAYANRGKSLMRKMSNIAGSYIETVLNNQGISYRTLPRNQGIFYFCTIPSSGITFDLTYDEDGTIKLWRFIGVTSLSKIGTLCEYRDAKSVLGVEVTDEGDVNLYAECLFDHNNPITEKRILKIVIGYIDMITQFADIII